MGNKSKQDQGETTRMTDYEKSKLLRVQENQERLRELGIKKIANSHDHNGETGEDYPQEVFASVGTPKKVTRFE